MIHTPAASTTPVHQDHTLPARLQVVLLLQHNFDAERLPLMPHPHEQQCIPHKKHERGSFKRGQQLRVVVDRREQCETGKARRERNWQDEQLPLKHRVGQRLYQNWEDRSSHGKCLSNEFAKLVFQCVHAR
jgi:hypothetical protein